jgi:hypothetical protein
MSKKPILLALSLLLLFSAFANLGDMRDQATARYGHSTEGRDYFVSREGLTFYDEDPNYFVTQVYDDSGRAVAVSYIKKTAGLFTQKEWAALQKLNLPDSAKFTTAPSKVVRISILPPVRFWISTDGAWSVVNLRAVLDQPKDELFFGTTAEIKTLFSNLLEDNSPNIH